MVDNKVVVIVAVNAATKLTVLKRECDCYQPIEEACKCWCCCCSSTNRDSNEMTMVIILINLERYIYMFVCNNDSS